MENDQMGVSGLVRSHRPCLTRLLVAFLLGSLLIFSLIRLTPGGPEAIYLAGEDPSLSAQELTELRESWGIEQPFAQHYVRWVWNAVLQAKWGISYVRQLPTAYLWWESLPGSVLLHGFALVLTLGLSWPLRRLASWRWLRGASVLVGIAPLILSLLVALCIGTALTSGEVSIAALRTQDIPFASLWNPHDPQIPKLTLAVALLTLCCGLALIGLVSRSGEQKPHPVSVFTAAMWLKFAAPVFGAQLAIEAMLGWPGLGMLLVQGLSWGDLPVIASFPVVGLVVGVIGYLLGHLLASRLTQTTP